MSISPDLFMAILAMDSYNRGDGFGLNVTASGMHRVVRRWRHLTCNFCRRAYFLILSP